MFEGVAHGLDELDAPAKNVEAAELVGAGVERVQRQGAPQTPERPLRNETFLPH